MKLTVSIDLDNAAFAEDGSLEAARILRELADKIEAQGLPPKLREGMRHHHIEPYWLRDLNGNKVGQSSTR